MECVEWEPEPGKQEAMMWGSLELIRLVRLMRQSCRVLAAATAECVEGKCRVVCHFLIVVAKVLGQTG